MDDDRSVPDILEDAADYLRVNGWQQGSLYANHIVPGNDDNPSACIMGAMFKVQKGYKLLFNEACASLYSQMDESLTRWNDTPGRTAEEVIDLLVNTAKDLRNNE